MSEKSKANGHAKEAEVHVESAGTTRMRKSRERKKAGVIVIRNLEIGPDFVAALIQFGWLFAEQKHDAGAVSDAIGAIVYASLNAGMRPATPGRAYVPVSHEAVSQAAAWLRPDEREQITIETAGKALTILADCASLAGFVPEVYAARARQLVQEIQAKGIVPVHEMTH